MYLAGVRSIFSLLAEWSPDSSILLACSSLNTVLFLPFLRVDEYSGTTSNPSFLLREESCPDSVCFKLSLLLLFPLHSVVTVAKSLSRWPHWSHCWRSEMYCIHRRSRCALHFTPCVFLCASPCFVIICG